MRSETELENELDRLIDMLDKTPLSDNTKIAMLTIKIGVLSWALEEDE